MNPAEALQALKKYDDYKRTHRLKFYQPYPFQQAFHFAKRGQTYISGEYDYREGELATDRAIISANQVGKTLSAAAEVAMHLTGQYPDDWKGHRFKHPVKWLVAGKTNDTTRDVCQKELFGDPKVPDALGTGMIPEDCIIGKPTRKAGVPMAFQSATIRHISGGTSTVQLMAYEQGPPAFMGRNDYDGAWEDEEPPEDVQSQIHRCFFAKSYYTILLTFTPEEGYTNVVDSFLTNLQGDQAVVRATWDDAPHMTEEAKESFLAKLPPHERDMRSKGIPMMGSGLVFPIVEDQIIIDPIPIPAHWRRICGIDFGIDHPFGAAWIAYDGDTDTVHIYSDYRIQGATPPVHASAIKQKGTWIPVAWPHDGLIRDKGSGIPLADIYRSQEHLNLLPDKFSNPPGPGQKEGQGGNGVEVGIVEMWQRMETGRLKVHSNCQYWLDEFRTYHRKDNKIVAKKDDVISACFHPDTEVITDKGIEKISNLTNGNILTINGKYVPFANCRITQRDKQLVEVFFEDGYSVKCTPEHEFLTDEGWTQAHTLKGKSCYNVISCRGDMTWKQPNSKIAHTDGMEDISRVESFSCIGRFGKMLLERFLKSIISIIKIMMDQIIALTTLNVSMVLATFPYIKRDMEEIQYGFMKRKENGQNHQKGRNFLASLVRKTGISCLLKRIFSVNNAENNSSQRILEQIDSALTNVNLNGEDKAALMTFREYALNVEKNSQLINTKRQNFVQSHAAVKVTDVKKSVQSDVWCMTVPETNAFTLANGTIVHNSRYAIMSLRFAHTQPVKIVRKTGIRGVSNW